VPDFTQVLNRDGNQKLTSAVYDTEVAGWMQKNQSYVQSSAGIWVPLALDANGYLKASVKDSALPTGAATQTTLAAVLAKLIAAPATEAKQDTLIAKDFATQTTLDSILTLLTGTIIANCTNVVPVANADIIADYTAPKTMQSTLMVETATGGVLSLKVDGVLANLNSGIALDTGKWYAFDIPIVAASVYNLKFSMGATMQIKWIGGNQI